MDSAEERFTSMANVVHTIRSYLEKYNIPDRDYLSVNICAWCEIDILATAQSAIRADMYQQGIPVFMGMTVNRKIPPINCIICRGKNG